MRQRCSSVSCMRLAPFLLFFALSATILHAAEPVAGAPLVIEGLGRGTVALDGPWQFRVGDDPAWSSPTLDDTGWEHLRVDRPWGDQGHYGYAGFAWYRRHIDFIQAAGPLANVMLYMPHVRCAYELYWNDQLIGHFGSVPARPFFRFALPQTIGLGRPRQGVLAIRVWTAPLDSASAGNDRGMTATPLVGTPEAVAEIESANKHTQAKLSLVGFVQMVLLGEVVLIGFAAWVRNRNQKLLFWMIMFVGASILTLLTTPLDIPWLHRIQTIVLWPVHCIEDISLWYLLLYLLDLDRQPSLWRWAKILAVVSLVSATLDNLLFTLAWSNAHVKEFQILDVIFTAGFSVVQLFPFLIIGYAFKRKLDRPRWFVAGAAFAVEMYDVVQHTAEQGQRLRTGRWLPPWIGRYLAWVGYHSCRSRFCPQYWFSRSRTRSILSSGNIRWPYSKSTRAPRSCSACLFRSRCHRLRAMPSPAHINRRSRSAAISFN
jgi:hypothetical protein